MPVEAAGRSCPSWQCRPRRLETPVTEILEWAAEIMPELLIPPEKLETLETEMPLPPAENAPALLMPPAKLEPPTKAKNAGAARRDRAAG